MNATENLMKTKLTSHSKYLRKLYIASLSAAMLTVQVRHASAQTEQDMIEVARSVVAVDRKAVVVAAIGPSSVVDSRGPAVWSPAGSKSRGTGVSTMRALGHSALSGPPSCG